jgi:hypothetical protein
LISALPPPFFRENAKTLRFDALIEKEGLATSPLEDKHPAVQLNPRKKNAN